MNTKMLTSVTYGKKLAKIERDIFELKQRAPKRLVSLRGILAGIRVSAKEISRAKKSLFKS